jgi:hypothetical protein
VTEARRERVADLLILTGAAVLFASLFLTWSHQFSLAFLARWGGSDQLRGVPHDPTAWQAGLAGVALIGTRAVRAGAMVAVGLAVAFILRALTLPPITGANIFDPSLAVPNYFPHSPGAGVGETVAIAGLGVALAGLLLSFTAD